MGKRVVGPVLALAVTLVAVTLVATAPRAHADTSVTVAYFNGNDDPDGPLVVFVGNVVAASGGMWVTTRSSTVAITVDDAAMKLGRTVPLTVLRGSETIWKGCVGSGQVVIVSGQKPRTGLFLRLGESIVGKSACSSTATAGVMKVTNVWPW